MKMHDMKIIWGTKFVRTSIHERKNLEIETRKLREIILKTDQKFCSDRMIPKVICDIPSTTEAFIFIELMNVSRLSAMFHTGSRP